ncbi:MAG: hypothetical protein ACRDYA_11490 [Egibacteraceae bacterium]
MVHRTARSGRSRVRARALEHDRSHHPGLATPSIAILLAESSQLAGWQHHRPEYRSWRAHILAVAR